MVHIANYHCLNQIRGHRVVIGRLPAGQLAWRAGARHQRDRLPPEWLVDEQPVGGPGGAYRADRYGHLDSDAWRRELVRVELGLRRDGLHCER